MLGCAWCLTELPSRSETLRNNIEWVEKYTDGHPAVSKLNPRSDLHLQAGKAGRSILRTALRLARSASLIILRWHPRRWSHGRTPYWRSTPQRRRFPPGEISKIRALNRSTKRRRCRRERDPTTYRATCDDTNDEPFALSVERERERMCRDHICLMDMPPAMGSPCPPVRLSVRMS